MRVIFGFQDVLDIIELGFASLGQNPTEAERAVYREARKRDCKAMFLLHQCVDVAHFEKISLDATSKEAWSIL
jgi:hypothetical protein